MSWPTAKRWAVRYQEMGEVRLDMQASTVHAALVRCRLNPLSHIDIRTGEMILRYEHPHPGLMIHVDVKKLGNIPDGGGWRYVGREQGRRERQATPGTTRSRHRKELLGHAYLHTAIDDHSCVAYAEIHNDETATTAVGVLRRAVSWFAAHGATVERVRSDNGRCYRSPLWKQACTELADTHKRNRPYGPQTNARSVSIRGGGASGGLTLAKV